MGGIIVSKHPYSTGHQIKQGCCDKKFPSDDYIAVIISNGRLLASCHIACWAIWHLLLIDVCAHASLLMIYHTRDHTLDHTITCLLIKAIYMLGCEIHRFPVCNLHSSLALSFSSSVVIRTCHS